jgi:hypothetical protein
MNNGIVVAVDVEAAATGSALAAMVAVMDGRLLLSVSFADVYEATDELFDWEDFCCNSDRNCFFLVLLMPVLTAEGDAGSMVTVGAAPVVPGTGWSLMLSSSSEIWM